jgi:electron transport complex protein RnfG
MSTRAPLRPISISALVLGCFALVGTGLVAFTNDQTHDRIAENRRARLVKALGELVDPSRYDNAIDSDSIEVSNRHLLGTEQNVTVYRARKSGRPIAVLLTPVAPGGYSGAIDLLVAINRDGTLAGVRVTSHRETPGLGDAIEVERSDWVKSFAGRSLENPSAGGWRLRKDGGEFDQLTGATITPRAVVSAVRKALQYYRENRDKLFAEASLESDE